MNGKKKILVIDDNVINLKLASDLLAMEGFEVFSCLNAEEALELLKQMLPDLILMDIALPGMDGLQLTQKLRSEDLTKNIRIVAVTAFAMKGDMERIIAAGCDGVVTKPIDTRNFAGQIAVYL